MDSLAAGAGDLAQPVATFFEGDHNLADAYQHYVNSLDKSMDKLRLRS